MYSGHELFLEDSTCFSTISVFFFPAVAPINNLTGKTTSKYLEASQFVFFFPSLDTGPLHCKIR